MRSLIERIRDLWRDPARRNLFITVGVGLLVQGMLVITGPFLARLLGPSGRGDLAVLMLWPVVLVQVGCLGIPAAVTYYVSTGSPWRDTIRRGIGFGAAQVAGLTVIQVVLVTTVLAQRGAQVEDAAWITVVAVPGLLAQEYGLAIHQARADLTAFNAYRVLPISLFAGAVIAMFLLSADLVAVTASWVGAVSVIGVINFITAVRSSSPADAETSPLPTKRSLFSYGVRGILSANSAIDIARPDQIALAVLLPSRALGIYVVGQAFTNLPGFVAKAIGLVAFPAVARQSDPDVARRVAWRYIWIVIGLAAVITGFLLATVSFLIPIFFGERFRDSIEISHILLTGAMFTAIRRVLAETMRGRGQPGPGTAAEIVAILWLVVAIVVLVPLVGAIGVAIALSSSQIASFVLLVGIALRRGELRRHDAVSSLKDLRFALKPRQPQMPAGGT